MSQTGDNDNKESNEKKTIYPKPDFLNEMFVTGNNNQFNRSSNSAELGQSSTASGAYFNKQSQNYNQNNQQQYRNYNQRNNNNQFNYRANNYNNNNNNNNHQKRKFPQQNNQNKKQETFQQFDSKLFCDRSMLEDPWARLS
jgi:hypothetical protein